MGQSPVEQKSESGPQAAVRLMPRDIRRDRAAVRSGLAYRDDALAAVIDYRRLEGIDMDVGS